MLYFRRLFKINFSLNSNLKNQKLKKILIIHIFTIYKKILLIIFKGWRKTQRLEVLLHTSQEVYGARFPVHAKITIIACKGLDKTEEIACEFGRKEGRGIKKW